MAKFKVGDKVKFRNLFKPERGEETGVVTGYDTDGSVLIRDDDGIKVKASEKLVRLANSVRNAKFKVGDEVVFKANGHRGEVKKIDGGKIGVRWAFSSSVEWHNEDELQRSANSVRTTNAVVAKAMNAVRNAWADAPDAATAKRDIEQTVRKATEIAKRRYGAPKATYKMTPNDSLWCGYIDLTFNTEEEAKKCNPYYLFDELGDNKSILPKWSWAIGGFNYQKTGKVVRIFIGTLNT